MSTLKSEIKNNHKFGCGQTKSVFNSKLFLDVDVDLDKEGNDELNTSCENNTEESDNSFEMEEINCLSNELIEELDNNSESPKEKDNKINNTNKNNNIIDSLLSLANNGYEFKPKNYKPSFQNNPALLMKNTNNNNYNYNCINPLMHNKIFFFNPNTNNNINNIRDQKKDWICTFCKNLNYSFRTKCNRCKVKKEDSDKRKNLFINFAL